MRLISDPTAVLERAGSVNGSVSARVSEGAVGVAAKSRFVAERCQAPGSGARVAHGQLPSYKLLGTFLADI